MKRFSKGEVIVRAAYALLAILPLASSPCALLGLELALCGALSPRLSMSAWSGIRVPWELSEEK